jgi:polar amino acid transport system substrate-binding protein
MLQLQSLLVAVAFTSADVDRRGIKLGAVKGQSQQIYVSENLKNAEIKIVPEVPPGPEIVKMLVAGEIDAFAANRQRMEDIARTSPSVRVLPDNFSTIGQALVVDKGDPSRLAELNRFIADIRASGLVRSSIDRAKLTGVEVAR